ncbi:hypothetical protein [Pantoea sp. PGP6]
MVDDQLFLPIQIMPDKQCSLRDLITCVISDSGKMSANKGYPQQASKKQRRFIPQVPEAGMTDIPTR